MDYKIVQRFISRMSAGCIVAIILGNYVDDKLQTSPLFVFALLAYVVIGSLVLLVKEAGKNGG